MVTYSQRDARLRVNSADLFCSSVSMKFDASLTPVYTTNSKSSFDFATSKASEGKLDITYFLTGSDPLVDNMVSERTPIALNFNGLSVNSGYLTSYAFDANPFSAVEIKASFTFYEKINGTFTEDTMTLTDLSPLSVSDMTLDNGTIVDESKIKNINYSYQSTISPSYVIEEDFNNAGANIGGVVSKDKKIQADFALYDYDLSLPVSGQKEVFNFNFKDKNGQSLQTYSVNGFINNKSIGARTQDIISSNYSIVQANLGGGDPVVHPVSPITASVGTQLTISGTNFVNVESVLLGEFPLNIVSTASTTGIVVEAPNDVLNDYSAPITVITQGGQSSSTNTFTSTGGTTSF